MVVIVMEYCKLLPPAILFLLCTVQMAKYLPVTAAGMRAHLIQRVEEHSPMVSLLEMLNIRPTNITQGSTMSAIITMEEIM